ncbi:MAG: hypothetical protein JWN67_3484 [Actinomycetia bacterium]|nr:hypothetical protein [Actinomycetes bacterium]
MNPDPDLGTVTQTDDGWQLRWERHLPHPVDEVWRTLTDPDRVRTWWGILDVDLRVGGRYVMAWQNPGGPTMHAVITACDPPRVLETEGDIHGRLRWELTSDGDGTSLVFTNTLAEAPASLPDNLAGWHWHVVALERTLAGDPLDPALGDMSLWEELRARYVEP